MVVPMHLAHLLPQIVLVAGAALTLVVAMVAPRARQWTNAPITLVVLAVAAGSQLALLGGRPVLAFQGLWALDAVTGVASLTILGITALVVPLVPEWLRTDARHGEYHTMLLLGALGAMVMVAATDLNELVVGVVLSSVTGYVLAAYHRGAAWSVEAGMKYFLVGALANVVLLVAVVLGFAAAGTTGYPELGAATVAGDPWLLVPFAATAIAALAFKAGAVPAHAWVPDVAQGAPAPSAAFLTVVPKIGGVVALARLLALVPPDLSGWRPAVAVAATLTMTLGNLAALPQTDVRRLLGWSSVSQAGYALVAVAAVGASDRAVPALVGFLAAYGVANVAAFAVIAALRGRTALADHAGLARRRPLLAVVLVVALLSLVGIPPLAGFAGKLAVFTAAVDAGLGWLAVVAVCNTVLSLAYYLRVVGAVVRGEPGGPVHLLGRWATTGAVVAGVAVVVVGLAFGAVVGPVEGGALLPAGGPDPAADVR